MGKKEETEELKKLEDEAYFELCQIIAEAMQVQDVNLLNERIAYWKNKYKKLLDGSASPAFKKKIEFLLTQYYSSITQYILSQLKFKEKKKIENQGKALRELYVIIRDTKDLPSLEKNVKEWKSKYPVQSFLNMYQKKIASYTRKKNLQDNAFEQDKAFSELVDITKKDLTFNELNQEIKKWKKDYSIENKYSIDDFIKHQSEVNRYVSDEYLISISKDLNANNSKNVLESSINNPNISQNTSISQYLNLANQAQAYSSLLSIVRKPNNTDDVFKWVYKNKSIKFDDKYSELILNATYLDYSPKYLNLLSIPNFDISNPSLSFEVYKNIDTVKRYAIISYFNLLLPPEKAVANNYFNKHIETIYNIVNQKHDTSAIATPQDVELQNEITVKYINEPISNEDLLQDTRNKENNFDNIEIDLNPDIINLDNILNDDVSEIIDTSEKKLSQDISPEHNKSVVEPASDEAKDNEITTINYFDTLDVEPGIKDNVTMQEQKIIPEAVNVEETENIQDESTSEITIAAEVSEDKPINYNSIVAISPQFFTIINNYSKQASLVNEIDKTTTNYVFLAMPTIDKTKSRNIF